MKYLALLIFLTLHLSIHTQVLKGVVLDSITNEKLPYANLVIKGKKNGTYSNDHGIYNFNLPKATIEDTVAVSLIGYHNKKIALSQFIASKTHILNFKLLPKHEFLDEVLIVSKSKKYSNNKIQLSTGNRKQVFPSSVPFGYETATLIENPKHKKGKLIELHLKFKNIKDENFKTYPTYFRLAFYSVDDFGFPGELLDFENIIIKPEKETRNYKINLEDKTIQFTKKGIFIGIETIKPDAVNLESAMYLTTPNILYIHTNKKLKYSRFGSNNWSKHSRKSALKKKLYTVPFIKLKVVFEKE